MSAFRSRVFVATAICAGVSACTTVDVAVTTTTVDVGPPIGVIAIGHSGLTGEGGASQPGVEARDDSWATGTQSEVNSIYSRLIAVEPDTDGHVANMAQGGAVAASLPEQAAMALTAVPNPMLVIIQTIDNDIRCDGTDETHVPEFGASLAEALSVIVTSAPESKIVLITQRGRPAGYAAMLIDLAKTEYATGSGMCDMFDPSTGELVDAHVDNLTAIIENYEAEQARVCAEVPQCTTDDGIPALIKEIPENNSADLNHLNAAGQALMAETLWPVIAKALGLP